MNKVVERKGIHVTVFSRVSLREYDVDNLHATVFHPTNCPRKQSNFFLNSLGESVVLHVMYHQNKTI